MLFTYEQGPLKDLLSRFSHVVAKENSHIPQLSHVKVEVQDNKVIFTGTDQELSLVEVVPTNEGNKVGHCTFPVKSLLDLVKNLSPTKPIKIELVDEKRLQLRQGRSRYCLSTTDPTVFPSPSIPLDNYCPVEPKAFLEALSSVDYAISEDEGRGALNGLLLEPADEEGFMRAVASDGRRLASCKVPGVIKAPIVLSKRGATAIKKILPGEEEASILATETHLYITLENSTLVVRLIAQIFPNYKAAFPQGGHHIAVIQKSDTIKSLKRICIFSGDKVGGRTRFIVSPEKILFKVRSEKGDAEEEINVLADSEIKSEVELQINPFFLQQALEKFTDERISIRIYSDLSPILLFGKENTMALVMPRKS